MVLEVPDIADISALPGFKSLWAESMGDPRVCVAVLDGPVDQSHPCFDGANLTRVPTLVSGVADPGVASQHGTHVTSVIFGQHDSPVLGIAPSCRGLIVPVFTGGSQGGLIPCSQMDLARAITQAVEQGANVINISGGQLVVLGESDQFLANAVRLCVDNNVLIVAATGNDGCDCLHVPAALESVLAVGAMDLSGNPIGFSNWGKAYQKQGILAPGENILGALPGGGTVARTGTSFATPIVSGLVALLLSIQLKQGKKPDPHAIRDAILKSALPCNSQKNVENRRCLVGTLNISGTQALITKGGIKQVSNLQTEEVTEEVMLEPSQADNSNQDVTNQLTEPVIQLPTLEKSSSSIPAMGVQAAAAMTKVMPASVNPSECAECAAAAGGEAGGALPQLVYALGELGTDFGTEARRDSFMQAMPSNMNLLDYLAQNPWEAQSLIWTLNLDATPIYAIVPMGAYASVTYERLRSYLADEEVERVSIPGYIGGQVRLMSGQVVPAIIPEVRGMYSWSVAALVRSVRGMVTLTEEISDVDMTSKLEDYLNRVYYDYRNLGVTPQERALNFSATNAFQASVAIAAATGEDRVLDTIDVTKSPICRPDSDCYDVKLTFFDPENNQRSNRVYRFTIDVSDVIPVTIGQMRSWSQS